MRTAVILSTYNAPQRLEPTLIGYAAQRCKAFELIVADDGSTRETSAVIENVSRRYGLAIRHVWQPDDGFRKCRILNHAVLATNAQYLIFSDGDCIPRADFVEVHVNRARPKRFLSGGYFKLTAETSERIDPATIMSGAATDPHWLRTNGTPNTAKLAKLQLQGWRAEVMNALTPTRPTWNGHNSSCWRNDLLRVNGYDERMAYWAQDREFGERLENAGVRGLQIRYSAVCVHIHHERPYKTQASRDVNRRIRAETRRDRATWTATGIVAGEHRDVRHALAPDIVVREFAERQAA